MLVLIVGSNIATYLDQLWVSNIVKLSYKQYNKVTNENSRGWSPIDNVNNTMDESRELRLQHTNAYKFNSVV